jgi:hypothetical protein
MKDKIVVTFDINGQEIKRRYNKSLFPSSATSTNSDSNLPESGAR